MKKYLLLFMLCFSSFNVKAMDVGVYIKDDGLYKTDFTSEANAIKLNNGQTFQKPRLNKIATHVAYTDSENKLYVQNLDNESDCFTMPIDKNVIAYAWQDGQLVYAKETGGLFRYNLSENQIIQLIDKNSKCENITLFNNMMYANKFIKAKGEDKAFDVMVGLVEINLSNLQENRLLDYKGVDKSKDTIEGLGFVPQVARLSDDGQIVYVWCKVNSASLNSDRVGLGYYDLAQHQFTIVESIAMLAYSDQLDINPMNHNHVVLINGQGRMMNDNKKLELLVLNDDKVVFIQESGMVAMTPSFSKEGDKIIYSAGIEQKETYKPFQMGQNHIYELNVLTKESRQLTFGDEVFDFYPRYLSDGSFTFIRRLSNKKLYLVKRDINGKETTIASDLLSDGDNGYYGHLDMDQIFDLKTRTD